jgi:hypothetical protein
MQGIGKTHCNRVPGSVASGTRERHTSHPHDEFDCHYRVLDRKTTAFKHVTLCEVTMARSNDAIRNTFSLFVSGLLNDAVKNEMSQRKNDINRSPTGSLYFLRHSRQSCDQ